MSIAPRMCPAGGPCTRGCDARECRRSQFDKEEQAFLDPAAVLGALAKMGPRLYDESAGCLMRRAYLCIEKLRDEPFRSAERLGFDEWWLSTGCHIQNFHMLAQMAWNAAVSNVAPANVIMDNMAIAAHPPMLSSEPLGTGETPRMDAALALYDAGKGPVHLYGAGCKLERELAGAKDDVKRLHAEKMALLDKALVVANAAHSATRPSTIPLLKRLREQRDLLADALRLAEPFIREEAVGLREGNVTVRADNLRKADVAVASALAITPTYEQQLRNIANGIGMDYDEMIAALEARRMDSTGGKDG